MQMVNTLAAMFAFIDHSSVAWGCDAFQFCNLSYSSHEVAKKCGMAFFSFANARKPISVLGDHKEVDFSNGIDVSEGKAELIFIYDCSRDLFPDYFVENRDIFRDCGLGFLLLFNHFLFDFY